MIRLISNLYAVEFMSQFPEMESSNRQQATELIKKGYPVSLISLGVYKDNELVGLFPCNISKVILIHVCFLPQYRGEFAVQAAHAAFEWIFTHTDYKTIYAYIEFEHAKEFARRCGMIEKNGYFEVSS